MKATLFMFLAGAALFARGPAAAQTETATPAPPAPTTSPAPATSEPALDPAKVAEYQQRFEQGYALEKAGQLSQARTIYDGILAEQPDAKRSLLEAGRISLALDDPLRADGYLEKLHALVPDFPEAFELLIQANEALRRDVKVERLVAEFRELRDSGKVPGFRDSLFFEREHLRLDHGAEIVFSQFFNYTAPPYYAVRAELFGTGHVSQRVLLLKYDPEGTQQFHQKDPHAGSAEVFILAEPIIQNGRMTRIDVYDELFATPYYAKVRQLMLGVFAASPKPIYSAPVDAPAH
jgi:tetratricopeptide (TPR) repeat protein